MGYRLKPVLIVVLAAVAAAVFICAGLIAYKLKTGGVAGSWGLRTLTKDDNNLEAPLETSSNEDESVLKSDGPEWERHLRLSPDVYPLHYRLHLHPDFDQGTFTGHVSIHVNVSSRTDHIRLHVKYLNISSTELSENATGKPVAIQREFEHERNEYWVVQPMEELLPDVYNLTLHFAGSLTRGIVGFYRSQYFDAAANTTKYVVSSKFQPTYARRAFPCFDEPSFKSTYKISLVKPTHLTALSNMPVESEHVHENAGLTTVHYENSVPMVTYLVAFAIGDFGYKEGVTKSGVPVRVYATSSNVMNTEFAISITPAIVEYFEEYFGIKYPLPKLDIIGVPDFIAGATEHWGLISFREVNLLYNPLKGSAASKQRIAAVVAHELAHMWFGNLVTLKWWDDLWLNEGFASFIEYAGMNAVHPEWEMMSQFVSLDLAPVLQLDGQLSSHPIVQQVSNPNQINEIFDTIAYQKGSSVIRMLRNFMGPKNFQQGLSKFLKKFAFKNAITEDLWDSLQTEAPPGVNVSFVMDTWTRQMGYPVVAVTSDDSGVTAVSQQRFFEDPNKKKSVQESPFGFKWEIPMLISTSEGPTSTQLIWLEHGEQTMNLDVSRAASWVKVNTGQLGYFRVKYDSQALKQISRDLQSNFSPEERCGLMDDIFALAYANYTSYEDAFQFALGMKRESHVVPWRCAENHLRRLLDLLNNASPDTYGYYKKYLNDITEDLYNRLQWTDEENDPHVQRILKPRIFSLACDEGNENCRRQASALFLQWLNNNVTVPTSLRSVVYKWGVWQGTDQVWDKVWQRYLGETDASEKITLLQALTHTQESWILSRLLEYAKYETLIRRQDYFLMCRYIASHPVGNAVIWNYYRNQMDSLIERFGLHDRYFGRLIGDITADFTTEIQLESMKEFFKKYPEAGAGQRARKSALENVQNNILWTKRSLSTINEWLKSRYS